MEGRTRRPLLVRTAATTTDRSPLSGRHRPVGPTGPAVSGPGATGHKRVLANVSYMAGCLDAPRPSGPHAVKVRFHGRSDCPGLRCHLGSVVDPNPNAAGVCDHFINGLCQLDESESDVRCESFAVRKLVNGFSQHGHLGPTKGEIQAMS